MKIKKLSYYLNASKKIPPMNSSNPIKVSFLGSYSLNGFDDIIRVQCYEEKINCITYNGGYNQYNQEVFDKNSDWNKFNSDITFLIIDTRTILNEFFYFPYNYSRKDREKLVDETFLELKILMEKIIEKSSSYLVITNFQIPTFSPFGIFESKTEYGLKDMVISLNQKLKDFIYDKDLIFIYDFNSFVTKFGEYQVIDEKKMFAGDMRISFDMMPFLIYDFLGYIKPLLGINKKCLVLDLDNTLWGGIVGEDGIEQIRLGPDPEGRSFIEFQKTIKSFSQRGIILAINSKNNFNDAMNVINNHPYMILKQSDFASIKINWNDKISNMKEIAADLNIGLDSLVFIDDDPRNRELIKMAIPDVSVVELPDEPSNFAKTLRGLNDFNVLKITNDDFTRNKMYIENKKRNQLEKDSTNLDEYLKKLEIKINLYEANDFLLPRISQLINKTNQFNLTTKRYQEDEIKKFFNDDNIMVGCCQVVDKFGDNGITNVFIIKKNSNEWILDTFLLSCRIMGRGIENGILGKILQIAKSKNIKKFRAHFIPTQKNKPSENFLKNFGFKKDGNDWIFNLENNIDIPSYLEVSIE